MALSQYAYLAKLAVTGTKTKVCQQGRLCLSTRRGNTKLWVFTFSRLVPRTTSAASYCFFFWITIFWSVLLGQAWVNRPHRSQKALLHPKRQYSSLENKHSPAVRLSPCFSLSFLFGSNTSATLVPIRRRHSTAKHETDAWELKISPVITKSDCESVSGPSVARQEIRYAAGMINSWGNSGLLWVICLIYYQACTCVR